MTDSVTCPTSPTAPDGTPHTIIGCGSSNVVEDDSEPGLYDCRDCGIWFNAEQERRGEHPEQEWLVTFTKSVSARSYAEAVQRADDGKGGGHWEATPTTPPALVLQWESTEVEAELAFDRTDPESTTTERICTGAKCPHCGDVSRQVIEVDEAVRWNLADIEVIGDILHLPYTTGQADFEHKRFICGECFASVSLPEGFTPDEDWV